MGLLRRSPDSAFKHAGKSLDRGVALSRKARFADAEKHLVKATKVFEKLLPSPLAWLGLGKALWRLSLVRFAVVAGVGHDSPGLLVAVKNGRAAAEALERAPGATAELARCHCDLVSMELEAGLATEALAHAHRAIELAEGLAAEGRSIVGVAHHNAALAHRRLGQRGKAAKQIESALRIRKTLAAEAGHPSIEEWEHTNSLVLSAQIYRELGKPTFAANALVRAAEIAVPLGPAAAAQLTMITQEMRLLEAAHPGVQKGKEIHLRMGGV